MVISVVVCTHNQCEWLRESLDAILNQECSGFDWEVIVVDNASTDNTRQLVQKEYANRVCYLFEGELGLSNARNTGLRCAKGDYIAYVDDDALPTRTWLATVVNSFQSVSPEPGCLGGRVDPIWETKRPDWLVDAFLPSLTVVNWGEQPRFLVTNEWVAGANMGYKTSLLRKVGGFPTNLGRRGKSLLSMEEVLVKRSIERLGYRTYYHPEARVLHRISAGRMNKKWFLKRSFWQGASASRASSLENPGKHLLHFGYFAYHLTMAGFFPFSVLLPDPKSNLFRKRCELYRHVGYVLEAMGVLR